MKKILKPLAFVLVALAQLAIPAYTLYNVSNIRREAALINLECRPVDPYNFMQGRYVILGFVEDRKSVSSLDSLKNYTNSQLKKLKGKEVYCIIEESRWADRYYIDDIMERKPLGHALFIKAKVKHVIVDNGSGRELRLKFSFDRYFLQEEYAPLAEKILRERGLKGNLAYLAISVSPEGETVAESLNIKVDHENGAEQISIEEFIDRELEAGRLIRD